MNKLTLQKLKDWFYYFKHGHPFLLKEEADIICKTREDQRFKHLNDNEIQTLIQIRISDMYENKYPNAKRWSLSTRDNGEAIDATKQPKI